MKLGKFEKVELRDCWKTEDKDFTPWLAQPENIEILSQEIGINLEVQKIEQNVGLFRADILCFDTDIFESDGKHYVLIENQLEITDHKHLGQLMTYAAGLDAVTIIWIASKFTEEHRAALDWLNRITDETFRFFGIEIELYKIGDSLPAPRFNIVAKPNNWSKDVKKTASNLEMSDAGALRQEYWNEFSKFMEANGSFLKVKNPSFRRYIHFAMGKSGIGLGASVEVWERRIKVYLWFSGDGHKEIFDEVKENCSERSTEIFGREIVWYRNEANNSSVIFIARNADYTDRKDWNNQFIWFKEHIEKFSNFFKPEIAKL